MSKPLSTDWAISGHNPIALLEFEESDREQTVRRIRADIVGFGLSQGYNHAAIRGVVADLYRTFGAEIELYIFAGADDLATAVTADATLAWLNLSVGQQTVREKLVSRLA